MSGNERVDVPAHWDDLWRIVSESLLGGIHHALNNRVTALGAISKVLGAGLPDASPLVGALGGEVQQLEQTVALISHLRRSRARNPEAIQLPALVASLTPLLPHHGDLKEIEFVADPDPGILPVYTERDLLVRVMLTLMTSAGLSAECSGAGRVRVSYRGNDERVIVRVACEPLAQRRAPTDGTTARLDARAVAEAVAELKGEIETVELPEGRTAYALSLPTLLAARKAEARG